MTLPNPLSGVRWEIQKPWRKQKIVFAAGWNVGTAETKIEMHPQSPWIHICIEISLKKTERINIIRDIKTFINSTEISLRKRRLITLLAAVAPVALVFEPIMENAACEVVRSSTFFKTLTTNNGELKIARIASITNYTIQQVQRMTQNTFWSTKK